MSVKPIHHYSMENPASVYDEEALTALELAARTAGKVNECSQAFNKLETETTEHLAKQDQDIDEAVDYMKDNIRETTASELAGMKENGEFAEIIEGQVFTDFSKRTNWVVTPEQFGAKGDGVADDTQAIMSAIETGKTVVMDKEYRIDTLTPPMGAEVVVNGVLHVYGTINIYYPDIKFTGSGRIRCEGAVCFTLKGIGNTSTTYCKNFYIGPELNVDGYMDKDCTAFLITAEEGADGVVVYPEINCKIRMFKYGIHSLYSGTDKAWFTSLRCRSIIENCRYAVTLDWHGSGSVFDIVVQPLVVKTGVNEDETPLVKVGSNCIVKCMPWDMGTAPNKYAVYATGTQNTLEVPNYRKYVGSKYPDANNTTFITNRYFNVPSTYIQGGETQPFTMPYDSTNDLAINAGNNKVSLTVTPSNLAGAIKNLLACKGSQAYQYYIANATAPDGVVLEFDFPEAVALRQMFVTGETPPDTVKFEYKNTSGEWVHLKTCVAGEDYRKKSGSENYAWWQFVYSYADGFTYPAKFAKGVRITMTTATSMVISKIHIGAVNNIMPTKMGDDLIATSFKIKGSDGKFYDITVQNGSLVATAEA
jgi:hypothetical protein